ncbi:MAG: hypothetical protein AAFY66_04850 [Pseudomonadota bacterium]
MEFGVGWHAHMIGGLLLGTTTRWWAFLPLVAGFFVLQGTMWLILYDRAQPGVDDLGLGFLAITLAAGSISLVGAGLGWVSARLMRPLSRRRTFAWTTLGSLGAPVIVLLG